MSYEVPIGISNKHIHLSKKDLEVLFGDGCELTLKKPLAQPGQFASEEKVDVVGPKKTISGVRILGPVRAHTQVELAMTDARSIGLKDVPIRESGKLDGTPGCKLVGPKGEIELEDGVIIAKRHVHLGTKDAEEAGVENGEIVSLRIEGERALTLDELVVRVNEKFIPEVHLDTDEGNAAALSQNAKGTIIKK